MASRSRLFSKIAKDIGSDGNLSAAALSSDISFGPTVYDSAGALPITGLTAGQQAWAGNRLYISNGSGWYNIALVNAAPRFVSITDSDGIETPYALSIEGTPITITLVGADSDGSEVSYSFTKDAGFDGLATITGTGSEYTITPLSQDSATTTSGTVTFKVSDGISFDTSVNTFTLNFVSPLWKNVVASVGHSDGQGATTAAVADRSGNGYSIGINSASGYPAQGSFHPYLDNWSVGFDGTDDYLTFPDNTDWDFVNSGDFTVDFWMNSKTTSNICTLGQSGGGGSRPDKWGLYINDTSVGLTAGTIGWHLGSNGNIQGPSITINAGQWYHIQVSRSGDTWYFFQDGTLLGTASSTTRPSVVANTLRVGSDGESYRDFSGYLSNFRIVKGTNLNTSSFTSPTENLTAITNTVLLTCQSNRFIDNSSNAYTATVVNTANISAFNPFGQGSEYARNNRYGSLWFGDNDNDASIQVTDGTVTDFGTNDFTIEFWFYPSGSIATTTYTIVNGFNSPGTSGTAEFYIQTSGQNKRLTWNAYTSIWTTVAYSNTDWKPYQWTHAAFVRNGTSCKIYQNGVEVASATVASNQSFNNDYSNTRIGCNQGNTSEFRGYLADFRITKGTAVYTSAFTPPTDKVGAGSSTVYLPMDNAYIYDKAGNGNILNNSSTVDNTYAKFGSFAYKGARFDLPIGIEADKWTLEFWWRGTGAGDYFNLYNSANTIKMRLLMQVDYGTNYTYRLGFTGGVSNKSGGLFSDGWNHVALVKNGGTTVHLYENGVYKASQSYGSEDITSSGGYIVFGPNHWYENIQFLVGTAKYTGTSGSFTAPTEEQGYGTQTTGVAG